MIALLIITGFSGMNPWILLPATLIFFREVFVSGLREFLGATAGQLKVTILAKWKTTAQMVVDRGAVPRHRARFSRARTRARRSAAWRGSRTGRPAGRRCRRDHPALGRGGADADDRLGIFPQVAALSEGADMIDVLYFAWVRERIGLPRERVETAAATVADLVAELHGARGALCRGLCRYLRAAGGAGPGAGGLRRAARRGARGRVLPADDGRLMSVTVDPMRPSTRARS